MTDLHSVAMPTLQNMRYYYKAVVRDIYDGDTFRADTDLGMGFKTSWKTTPFRMYGIDAPEMGSDEGRAARDFLRDLMLDREVIVKTLMDRRGSFSRWLAVVHHPDLRWTVNEHMVQAGHAKYKEY